MSTNNTSYKRVTPQVIAPMTDLDLTYKRNAPSLDGVYTPLPAVSDVPYAEGNAQAYIKNFPAIYDASRSRNIQDYITYFPAKYEGGWTKEGLIIGGGATPLPPIDDAIHRGPLLTNPIYSGGVPLVPYSQYDKEQTSALGQEESVYTPKTTETDAENAGIIAEIEKARQEGLTYAEGLKNDAYAASDLARQKGIVDADTSYQQNRATYGAKAEALRSMGLTGSGYSDHLDAQAYATKRDEIQSVKAQADAAKREADTTYAANTYQINKDADDKVMTYKQGMLDYHLTEAGKGAYTEEQINKIISDLGYGDAERNMLIDAMNTYNKAQEDALKATSAENYQIFLQNILSDASAYTDADLDRAVGNQILTAVDAAALKEHIVDAKRTEITDLISAGDTATAMSKADELYNGGNGKIDQPTYQKYYKDAWVAYLSGLSVGDKAANVVTIIAKLEEDLLEKRLSEEDAKAINKYHLGGKYIEDNSSTDSDGYPSNYNAWLTYFSEHTEKDIYARYSEIMERLEEGRESERLSKTEAEKIRQKLVKIMQNNKPHYTEFMP